MKSNLRTLLEEFLPEEQVDTISKRANELSLTVKVKKSKGRWHRETLRKLIKERGDYCKNCKVSGRDAKLTIDHIVPKQILLDMGLDEFYDDESNLEVFCAACNGRKDKERHGL